MVGFLARTVSKPSINIPRRSRGFFICGHSPRMLATCHVTQITVCQPRKICYLLPVNGFFALLTTHHRELFSSLIFIKLVLDVLLDLMCILTSSVHIVPSAPELSVPVLILQLRKLFIQHQTAFTLQVSHETRYCNLRRYLHQHM